MVIDCPAEGHTDRLDSQFVALWGQEHDQRDICDEARLSLSHVASRPGESHTVVEPPAFFKPGSVFTVMTQRHHYFRECADVKF